MSPGLNTGTMRLGIFGNKSGRERSRAARASALLQEACDRNTPVCVVKPTQIGRMPMARGRLLRLDAKEIVLEEVRVPGRRVEFGCGEDLDAYFSLNQNLYFFRTRLLRAAEPTRLNRLKVILGMTIARPSVVEQGDRRRLFRVSIGGLRERATVKLWRLRVQGCPEVDAIGDLADADGDATGLPPMAFNPEGLDLAGVDADSLRDAEYSGWLSDGTEAGLGIRLEFVRPDRFSMFEPVLVSVGLPGVKERMRLLCEVRSKRVVNEDGTRLGVVVIPEADGLAAREKMKTMRAFLTGVQRSQLRRGSKRSA